MTAVRRLRCRPEPLPQLLPPTCDEVVCRAVRLIVAGALDRSNSEDDLAAKLGFSARHLRRLVDQELGITPDHLARSARAHFARRLLDDTDISVTNVAYVTGFGSVRQFNRAMKEIFRATPRQLRANRRMTDRLVSDGGLVVRLRYLGGLDWPWTLQYLAERAVPGVEAVDDQTYRRTINVDGDPGVIEVFSGGDADSLLVRLHLPHWEHLVYQAAKARRLANVDLPLREAYDALKDDSTMRALLQTNPGLRPPGCWDPFEVAVLELIARETGAARAVETVAELVRRCGRSVPGLTQLGLSRLFPHPVELAEAVYPDVPAAPSIRALAIALRDGHVQLDGSVPFETLIETLAQLPGFDEELAHYVAFRMGETDAFPLRATTRSDLAHEATRWHPWRAVAAVHLGRQSANPCTN